MAFPTVADITPTTNLADQMAYDMSYPATVNAGDLLVAIVNGAALPDATSAVSASGWTLLNDNGVNNNFFGGVLVKKGAGTEGGTTVSVSFGGVNTATSFVAQIYRIPVGEWVDSGTLTNDVKISAMVKGSGVKDPPSLTPGWTDDTLWIVAHMFRFDAIASAAPTNYTNLTLTDAGTGTVAYLATARRELNAATEDPGVFTTDNTYQGGNYTIAIQPGSGATNRIGRCSQINFTIPSPFPIVEDVHPTISNALVTGHTFNLNAVINAGDLLLGLCVFSDNTTTAVTIPTDPSFFARVHFSQYNHLTFYAFAKAAVGNEDASSVIVTTSIATRGLCQMFRISNWANTGTILNDIAILPFNGFTGPPNDRSYDPPLLDPSVWDIENTLWLAGSAMWGNALNSVFAYPANYTDLVTTLSEDTTPRLQIHTMRRNLAAATEDPGAYKSTGANAGISWTLAIRPALGVQAEPRAGRASQIFFQVPAAPNRGGRCSQINFVIPDLNRAGQCSQINFTIPSNDREGRCSQILFTVGDFDKRGQCSQILFEIPSLPVPPSELAVFTLLVELEVAFEVSLINQSTNPWTQSGNAWFYSNVSSRTTIDNVRRAISSVTVEGGHELNYANHIFDCQNTDGTWTTQAAQDEVYVNPWKSVNPNESISLIRVKLYFSNYSVLYNGQFYEPRILLSPNDLNVRLVTNEALQGFALIEGQIRLANGDGFMDTILRDYIVIGQRITLKSLTGTTATNFGSKIVGEINRDDSIVTLKMWS